MYIRIISRLADVHPLYETPVAEFLNRRFYENLATAE